MITSKGNYNYRSDADLIEASKKISYCPNSGEIKRLGRKGSNGSVDSYGYLIIKINGVQWKAHRLAWVNYFGITPTYNIDHIDGNKLNNKISNLRDVPQRENIINSQREKNPSTGFVGISYDSKTRGLVSRYTTTIDGRKYRFKNISDAVKFRLENGRNV